MSPSQRIILNTLSLYGSSVVGMALGLFSSRWVLQALGTVDYGLMGVVGAIISFVTLLNDVMAAAAARFFSYSIGGGNAKETARWFNVSLALHLALPAALIAIGWPVGEWAIQAFLNIPSERLATAQWVFRLSLLSAFCNMSSTPFIGMHIAKQNLVEISLWGIIGSVGNFALAYGVLLHGGDAWLLYCAGTVAITVTLLLCKVIRAHILFEECRIQVSLWRDPDRARKVLSFSGWQLFGSLGSLLRGSGIAILLNKFFNPARYPDVNASYAIANSVSGYTQTLSTALLGAFTPEITRSEGSGDRVRMLAHANRASKFGTFLVLLFVIPLMLEIDYILKIWLKTPPQLAAPICVLILGTFVIDRLTAGQMLAVSARGKIAGYQAMLGTLLILTLPLAWLLLRFGFGATSVGWAYIITMLMCSSGRVHWAKRLVGLSPMIWAKDVLIPCLAVLCASLSCGRLAQVLWDAPTILRLGMVILMTSFCTLMLGWRWMLTAAEKAYVVEQLLALRGRFGSKAKTA